MQVNYTTINHIARQELGLSLNEYCLVDLIYNLSNNPSSKIVGWCYASKTTLGEMLGLSEQTIHSLLRKLEKKKIVIKSSTTKHLKVERKWYDQVVIKDTKESLVTLKKLESDTKETLVGHTKETLDNKDIYNKDNTKIVISKDITADAVYGNSDINEIIDYFKKTMDLPLLDGTIKSNRYSAKRLLVKTKNNMRAVKMLIDCLAVDEFHSQNASSLNYLEKHAVAIAQRARKSNKIGVVT